MRHLVLPGLLLLSLWLRAPQAAAQSGPPPDTTAARADTTARLVDLQADRFVAGTEGGESVRRLIGNVFLREGETQLRADRAIQYVRRDEVLFTGDVRIVERGDSLWADEVLYDRQTKVGQATGRVRLSDGEVLVTAPSGRYFTREKRAVFEEGVMLVDSTATLTSTTGTYWSDEKRAAFAGEVALRDERTYLEADSVTYLRETDVSIARGDVFIERVGDREGAEADTTVRTLLFGQQAYNDDRAAYSRVEGRPLLVQLRTDSTGAPSDTLLIRARRLEAVRQDSLDRLLAVDSVRIWQPSFAAVADSAVYEQQTAGEVERQESRLYGGPLAWFEQSQVSGDTLRAAARDGSIDSLFVFRNAFVAQQDTVLDRLQQLRGQRLVGLFRQDTLRSLRVGPRAEAIFYPEGEGEAASGAVQTSADRIVFYLRGDELERVSIIDGVEGTYYPENLVPATLRLDGFVWTPGRRPAKADLLGEARIRDRLARDAADQAPPEPAPVPILDEEGPP